MKNHGFTLLETIIVLAVMTMFFVISIPLFTRFTESTKLETAARSVTSALRTARTYAIANNADRFVVFDTSANPNVYFVSEDGANPNEKRDKLPAGISFSAPPASVRFVSTGEAGAAVSLILRDSSNNTKTIDVERTTGRARMD